MGDLVVSVGKQNLSGDNASTATLSPVSPDAVVSATYTMTADAITIVAQGDNDPSGDYQLNLTYAFSDNMTISSEVDKGKTTTMVGTYTDGDMTFTVARQDDNTTDASIALDFGNADLTIGRVGERAKDDLVSRAAAAQYSHLTYKVAF